MSIRIGNGYDIHRLVPGRKLVLGGIGVDFDRGLMGHSDADIVLHALADAILGGLALPNIGVLFPNTDPRNENIDSREILLFVKGRLREQEFAISNLDITILAEEPKLSPFIIDMRASIASILDIQMSQVGIKVTTNEGLGDIGQKRAMAAFATVLLQRIFQ